MHAPMHKIRIHVRKVTRVTHEVRASLAQADAEVHKQHAKHALVCAISSRRLPLARWGGQTAKGGRQISANGVQNVSWMNKVRLGMDKVHRLPLCILTAHDQLPDVSCHMHHGDFPDTR